MRFPLLTGGSALRSNTSVTRHRRLPCGPRRTRSGPRTRGTTWSPAQPPRMPGLRVKLSYWPMSDPPSICASPRRRPSTGLARKRAGTHQQTVRDRRLHRVAARHRRQPEAGSPHPGNGSAGHGGFYAPPPRACPCGASERHANRGRRGSEEEFFWGLAGAGLLVTQRRGRPGSSEVTATRSAFRHSWQPAAAPGAPLGGNGEARHEPQPDQAPQAMGRPGAARNRKCS